MTKQKFPKRKRRRRSLSKNNKREAINKPRPKATNRINEHMYYIFHKIIWIKEFICCSWKGTRSHKIILVVCHTVYLISSSFCCNQSYGYWKLGFHSLRLSICLFSPLWTLASTFFSLPFDP